MKKINKNIMNWSMNLTLVVNSFVFSLLIIEIGLRLIYKDKAADLKPTRDHSDPYIPRHMAGTHIHEVLNVKAIFDEFGMRYNPIKCPPGDKINVLLVGDSNISGLFLDVQKCLVKKSLRNHLNLNDALKWIVLE